MQNITVGTTQGTTTAHAVQLLTHWSAIWAGLVRRHKNNRWISQSHCCTTSPHTRMLGHPSWEQSVKHTHPVQQQSTHMSSWPHRAKSTSNPTRPPNVSPLTPPVTPTNSPFHVAATRKAPNWQISTVVKPTSCALHRCDNRRRIYTQPDLNRCMCANSHVTCLPFQPAAPPWPCIPTAPATDAPETSTLLVHCAPAQRHLCTVPAGRRPGLVSCHKLKHL